MATARPYHHGNLRSTVLQHAVALIDEGGPDLLSLRELARRAGVSHAAPVHHFGDRRGLLTAVAIEGFTLLAHALDATDRNLKEMALAYVAFALGHRGHYLVMFRHDLIDTEDSEYVRVRDASAGLLAGGIDALPAERVRISREHALVAAWSLVHGFASLAMEAALPAGDSTSMVVAEIAEQLFGAD